MAYSGPRLRLKGYLLQRLQVYEREGILLVEIFERVGKSVISVTKRPKRVNRCRKI